MNVRQLIAELSKFDGDTPVILDGQSLERGADIGISAVHQFDGEPNVALFAGDEIQE